MASKLGMKVDVCMADLLMLVSMTLPLMQGHNGSAKLCLCDLAGTLVPVPKSTVCYWDVNLILFGKGKTSVLIIIIIIVLILTRFIGGSRHG